MFLVINGFTLEIPSEHETHIASEIVCVVAKTIGIFAISEVENVVCCEKEVEVMTIAQHKIGTYLCTPQLISRRSVIYQVGFCIKAVLFCHKTMKHFSVNVVQMSPISDFPTQTLRGAERRD